MRAAMEATGATKPFAETSSRRRQRILKLAAPYALIAPAVAVLFATLGYPLYFLVSISFQRYGLKELLAHEGTWVGLQNYVTLFRDPLFWQVLARSVAFTLACVGATMVFGTLIALLLTRLNSIVRVLLTAGLVFVWATPAIVAVDLWQWMFDYEFGLVNWTLTALHVGNFIHHNWFYNPAQGFLVIAIVVVWGAIPFVVITLYAGLAQVPGELVEAARVDGAGYWQRFVNLTVPILKPIFLILASLSTIWDFQVFIQVWVMLGARPGNDYFLMAVYSYAESFRITQYGTGAAIAVVLVGLLMVLSIFYVRQMIKITDGGL